MTNVQTMRQQSYSCVVLALSLGAALSAIATSAHAQGPFSHSRTPVSGGATELNDTNGRSFGMNFRGGHTGGESVGRQDPLTHMSLSPYFSMGPSLGFFDVRLGRANEGGLTWSFGAGVRKYFDEADVVAGGNFYHSSDNITGTLLRTWGVGAEVLKEAWEVRANYVEPHGNTSSLVSQTVDRNSPAFVGNNVVFNRLDQVAEALKLVELEAGMRLPTGPVENVELRSFVGAYAVSGQTVRKATGWKTRLQADVGEYLELGVGLTQDPLTDTSVFFNATVMCGGYEAERYTKNSAIHRLADPVRRPLNVPALRTTVVVPSLVAINPADGLPLIVRHVDENNTTGPFLGTVEDPLQSITTALGLPGTDIVFTHAGGIYDAAPDNAVMVGPNMSLYGEGLITDGSGTRIVVNTTPVAGLTDELILPNSPTFMADMTLPRPTLAGAAGDSVTLLGLNSRFGGFIVDNAGGAGITSDGGSEIIIRDVMVQNSAGDGIRLANTTGTTSIIDSVITGALGVAFHVDGGNGSIGYLSNSVGVNPSRSNIENSSQEVVLIENTSGGIVNTTGITINDDGGMGVVIRDNLGIATIDNAVIRNSTTTGISVTNSNGANFRNSILSSVLIDNPAQQAVLIDGTTGQVTFSTLQIDGRNDAGIDINNNSGQILFLEGVTITAPNGGVAAAVSVDGSQAGSSVTFLDTLEVMGSNGRGIEITNNLGGSSFTTDAQVGLTLTTMEALFVGTDNSVIALNGGAVISNRMDAGVSIQNATGSFGSLGTISINNELDSLSPAFTVENSEANVTVSSLAIVNAMGNPGGGAGVNLVGNLAGAINTASHTYQTINIESIDGVGLFGFNNSLTSIRILDGTITSQNAAAVNLEESAWFVTLDSVTSTASPDFGIRLVNAVPPASGANTFTVGDSIDLPAIGTAGLIQGAGTAGAFLANAGQVRFRGMLFDSNATGIFLRNSGLADDDDQDLELSVTGVNQSLVRGIDVENLTTLLIEDSLFNDNGTDATLGRETILVSATEAPNDISTLVFEDFDNPYEVFIRRTIITDNTDDAITIMSESGALGAHIDVEVSNNIFTVDGDTETDLTDLNESALVFDWSGPSRVLVSANDVTLTGLLGVNDTDTMRAFEITHRSTTDEMLLSVLSNVVMASDLDAVGLDLQTFGPSDVVVDGNQFAFSASTGMLFSLAADTEMFLQNNQLRFDADGGSGVIFTLVNQNSTFTINNNQIGLFDDGPLIEEGIRFLAAIGTPALVGNVNNPVFLLNPLDPGAFVEIPSSFGGSFTGQIIVNGAAVP